ncbi:bifunctional 2-keto-4-hydroxyglutarate aldolase/2-keto-3-deoxy-6-phosphogluconate aldolase [Bacillus suaedae]|uniref:Bifunctional 2-keto-4-hydroxyglutarate aldolase/2-keto-3-deoxy-6-phosphogluconate aldolase n=1 Tax=Halalkalibacter suaedae TaxID=2822140 RepID=A0A941AP18_9BACI|nr:bifunctional 2-keto-4-hydroxyglutarate aldolase/2-keto-3-deoxy-6-phosphogluconate aldolase [Bacillus suaedae]MBP3950997.1 bifunctional 2-keto-4-hydroxyglutarate aldolase/2-keto-3-deoxy-6-phosphogluconate aldolase [Bacillus suaedae]
MKKYEVIKNISSNLLVAVVRGENAEEAIRISKACTEGGVKVIELTYTTPDASAVISQLKQELPKDILIGAGTVLDVTTARLAMLAGAEFIVSPSFDTETAKLCNLYKIPYMPGCMTITEMKSALENGCDVIKLFPGRMFGPAIVKDLKAPLPQLDIMPTGGVGLDNVQEWIKAGVCAVGVGGQLAKGTSEDISETARQFIKKIEEVRTQMGS